MFALDMNRGLWKDEHLYARFHVCVLEMNKAVAEQQFEAELFLGFANKLDDVMQEYENKCGAIDDPIFYWSLATANALFLLIGRKYDELGPMRIRYVINGYREGLSKHMKHPSYPQMYIDKAFEHMASFAEGEDEEWIQQNRTKFLAIEEQN